MNEQNDQDPGASIAEQYDTAHNHRTTIHVCEGYIPPPESLPLDPVIIDRANASGLAQILSQYSGDSLDNFKLIEAQEYSYEQQAQFLDVTMDLALPILRMFCTPDVEIGSFISADTGLLNVVYLSEMHHGIILCTIDENRVKEVHQTSSMEIWRYVYPPSRIVENIISMLIAVAEKHRSTKDEWIKSFQRIMELFNADKNSASKRVPDRMSDDRYDLL